MKLKPVNPDKYAGLPKAELQGQLVKRDVKASQEDMESSLTTHRLARLGSAAVAALLTGVVYQRKPSLERLLGTAVSLDHLLALGGSLGAFLLEDDIYAQVAEGVANGSMVPLLRGAGRSLGGLV